MKIKFDPRTYFWNNKWSIRQVGCTICLFVVWGVTLPALVLLIYPAVKWPHCMADRIGNKMFHWLQSRKTFLEEWFGIIPPKAWRVLCGEEDEAIEEE